MGNAQRTTRRQEREERVARFEREHAAHRNARPIDPVTRTILTPTELDALLATPYVSGGRTPAGVDCWGLALQVMYLCARPIPDLDVMHMDTKARHKALGNPGEDWVCYCNGDTPPLNDTAPLLLTLRLDHPKLYHHVGVHVGGNKIIHAQQDVGVSLEYADRFAGRIGGYYYWGGPLP
jgi:cell wall-associated NlpC family hydrolase